VGAAAAAAAPEPRAAAFRFAASVMAASSTAVVFAPSIGIVSTAKTLVPLTAEAIRFSASASANTTTTALGACCVARCTSARTSSVALASITSICPRLVPATSCPIAVSMESTGLTAACPPSASPSSSRKSSRSVSAVRSTVGRWIGEGASAGLAVLPDSPFLGALDAGLATALVSTLQRELFRARFASGPGLRAPHPLDNARKKRGFTEHIARPTHRSAAVHTTESAVR
jgi:hypothetical protein